MSIHMLARACRSPLVIPQLRTTWRYTSSSATSSNSLVSPATGTKTPTSSCPAQTVLTGLNWQKGQPPVLALEDSEYPEWLWSLLDEKKPGDGTSKAEMRQKNREKIRSQNFMKTQ
ncbi:hypothetical protein FRC08_013287 [Ceratobasidium sp. 394]|nr:hypothetical protein FRC08_013287 [Ceratobasidium sp. 394]KAG9076202.1 hypothetical protein FS749_012054 [Ceratobasidium sp. UAMH 11750]